MKRQIPLIITFFVGMLMIIPTWVPHPPFDDLETTLSDFYAVLGAFAFILGAGNLAKVHTQKITRKAKGWGYSAITMVAFLSMLIVGLFKLGNPAGLSGALEESGSYFGWGYDYVFSPLSSTMFALLAFFVASASYRAFRAKNREATLLLIAAFFLLLGNTLFGTVITKVMPGILEIIFAAVLGRLAYVNYRQKKLILAGAEALTGVGLFGWTVYSWVSGGAEKLLTLPEVVLFIKQVPQMAGQRAIMIGICLGVISVSLRIIMGVERSHLGSDE